MRRRHPDIVQLHWSTEAYQSTRDERAWISSDDGDSDEEEAPRASIPLYPIIKLVGAQLWKQIHLFAPALENPPPPEVEFIEVTGPVSDDVLPIIFGYLHNGVYLRLDVAKHLQRYMAPSQRLTPVSCDGDVIPCLALRETVWRTQLPGDWVRRKCSERTAPEFGDGRTATGPIFPDTFDAQSGVHLVGNHGNLFLKIVVWNSLRKAFPNVARWMDISRIVVGK